MYLDSFRKNSSTYSHKNQANIAVEAFDEMLKDAAGLVINWKNPVKQIPDVPQSDLEQIYSE